MTTTARLLLPSLGSLLGLALVLALAGCPWRSSGSGESPCADGGSGCAAANAPAGQRAVRRGFRIVNSRWLNRTNKESGRPDIGIQAEWAPITERR